MGQMIRITLYGGRESRKIEANKYLVYGGSNNWNVRGGDTEAEAGNQRKTEGYLVTPFQVRILSYKSKCREYRVYISQAEDAGNQRTTECNCKCSPPESSVAATISLP